MSRDKQTGFHISKESVDKIFPKKDIDILGYESPIQIAIGQMRMEHDNNIYRAVQEYGVDVDKDELIKALRYDRGQYEKGYVNGYNRIDEVVRAVFEDIEVALTMNHCQHKPFGSGEYVDYFANGLEEDIAEIKKKYTNELITDKRN
jgi:hypothetical protein